MRVYHGILLASSAALLAAIAGCGGSGGPTQITRSSTALSQQSVQTTQVARSGSSFFGTALGLANSTSSRFLAESGRQSITAAEFNGGLHLYQQFIRNSDGSARSSSSRTPRSRSLRAASPSTPSGQKTPPAPTR